ncbi:MAG: tRNA lysidine(34) synthetase TilS, partial [Candidatus Omnitrophica bacterium]|nr:tRNA lysidine(34) synthetase TilS [Candidatus Omnitrophota bacterium]
KLNLLEKGESFLVAVSGGPDSVACLNLLAGLREEWRWSFRAVHLNHLIRASEADKDEYFVGEMAKRLNCPFFSKRVDVQALTRDEGFSIEDAARRCRLEFFMEAARQFNVKKIVLAHTRDDQAETVLLRLLRGTGLRGLTAMQPRMEYESIVLVRPLLEVGRDDIVEYLKSKSLAYRVDPSNYSLKFSRNRVRHELIPELEKSYNPQIREHLKRLAETLSVDFNFIESEARSVFKRVIKKETPDQITLDRQLFSGLHEALQFRILGYILKQIHSDRDLDFIHWQAMKEKIRNKGGFFLSLSQKVEIGAERDEIIVRVRDLASAPFEAILEPGHPVTLKESGLVFSCGELKGHLSPDEAKDRSIAIFDLECVRFPLRIRSRKEGDRFKPLGQRKDKKLKDFFIDRKVQSYDKDKIPVVCSGDRIIWVFGVEISEDFKIARHTRRILRIEGKKP